MPLKTVFFFSQPLLFLLPEHGSGISLWKNGGSMRLSTPDNLIKGHYNQETVIHCVINGCLFISFLELCAAARKDKKTSSPYLLSHGKILDIRT